MKFFFGWPRFSLLKYIFSFFFLLSSFFSYAQWTQVGSDIDGEAANDNSGQSVSMNAAGDRMAIGAYANDGNGTDAGHVRVYEWNGTAWTQLGADIDGEAAGDFSGFSVSMNAAGDRIAIGALRNDGNGVDAGHVRIYRWNGFAWIKMGADIDGEASGDRFGLEVSMNIAGDRVAIGANYNDGNGVDAGHVRVYEWNGTAWIQVGADIDGEAAGDWFGRSVVINGAGDRVAIGAPLNDGNGVQSGHVRVYQWSGTAWSKMGVDIEGEAAIDQSGYSISMNTTGNRVAIGALNNDGNGSQSGHVRIYEWNGTAWVQLGTDIDGEAAGDWFGRSVVINGAGDRVAIGAINNDGNGSNSGHVRIYEWNGTAWVQLGADIDGEAVDDLSGNSVSMNMLGDRLAIGAYRNDGNGSNSGHLRVYQLAPPCLIVNTNQITNATCPTCTDGTATATPSGGTAPYTYNWSTSATASSISGLAPGTYYVTISDASPCSIIDTIEVSFDWQKVGIDLEGEAAFDYSGRSVSMNTAGDRMAIGATGNSGSGPQKGHVRIYEWNGTAWIQMGADIDGEAFFDNSGNSVSMNGDGGRVAIGAYANDGNGAAAGHVRIYEWNGTTWAQMGSDLDGEAAEDQFGYSVSMNAAGDRVSIGAPYNDGNGAAAGHVRIYEWNGTAWAQMGSDLDGEAASDLSGWSVSMNGAGDRVSIGARLNDGNGNGSGHVRVYEWNGTAWTQLGADLDGEAAADVSGWSVSMNGVGDRLAIGARENDGNGSSAGHVRIYEWNGTAWTQLGADIDGGVTGDRSGRSVSMNAAGNRVAIGSDGNSNFTGRVRMYEWNGMTWIQFGANIDGEASRDYSGSSVSMNRLGNRVAIGAPQNDGNGVDAGHVRVYSSTPPCSLLAAVTIQNQLSCLANSDGSIVASQSGGTSPYTYLWSNNASTNQISNLAEGTYTVMVTDGEGCTAKESVTLGADSCKNSLNLQLSLAYCGLVDLNPLNQLIVANKVDSATAYRFRISGGTVTSLILNTGSNFYFNINQITGITYGTTYTVEVTALVNGRWMAYGTPCTISTVSIANAVDMKLRAADCGATNVDPTNRLLVANQRADASAYRFRINGGSFNNFVLNTGTNYYFRTNQVVGFTYGTTYSVEVAALISGSWTNYGTPCNITTAPLANAVNLKLRYADCGASNVDVLNRLLVSEQRADATAYRFRINGGSLNNFVLNTGSNFYFNINQLSGVAYGTTYSVEVAALISGSWTNYGSPCNVTTVSIANAVNMKLRYADCDVTNVDPVSRLLVANQRADATAYRFRINGGALNNFVLNTGTDFYFRTNQASLANNATYTVEVAAFIGGSWTNYGTSCSITTAPQASGANHRIAKSREQEEISPFSIFPNPTETNSTVSVNYLRKKNVDSPIIIKVYDLSGKLMCNQEIWSKEQKFQYQIQGDVLGARGVYLIYLQDGNLSYSEKLVIK